MAIPIINVSILNGSNGFRLDGLGVHKVSNAGDINGDGFDDVIVGVPLADFNGDGSGSSYVVFGKDSGFDATLELSSLNGSNGFRLDGVSKYDNSGTSVNSAGDINGDGFDDLIIGAPDADPNDDRSGSGYVVFGQAAGFDAAMNLSSLDGSNGFRLDGVTENDIAGYSVSSAGDVNGDGFDDLLVSAPFANANNSNSYTGSSYVVFGKASGFDATLDLSRINGSNGFRLNGSDVGKFGTSVSSAGDVNSDGYADLIIGAPGADPNGDQSGSSYVVFGGNFFSTDIYIGTSDDDILTGTEIAERFEGGDGNDRMNGLGGADFFHGDAGDDTIAVSDLDFQLVDGGTGNDTLELAGSGINLSLVNFHDIISGIETIDLTGIKDDLGNDNNTLTLTLLDLLSLSDTTNTFTVNGNPGDRVVGLVDGWTDGGFKDNYRIYTNQGTVLRVDSSVSTDITTGVLSLADLDGNNGFRLDGVGAGDYSGNSVSNAGDVNGDGFDDVIIGAENANPNGRYSGSSYVVFGKATGFNAAMNLSSLDGTNGFRLDGEEESQAGRTVSTAGDVNGDGFDDLIIGAPRTDPNGVSSGSSYVVFGKESGFDAAMNLSSLDGSNGFRLDGEKENDFSGASVSVAGDVNGDGFDDLLIGAFSANPNGRYSGVSYVVFGKASVFDATINLASLDGSNGFRLDGVAAGDISGNSVSNAGDVNGDGLDDVIIGASRVDTTGYSSGSSYVVFGKESGFDAAMNLSSLDGSNGFRLDGVAENDISGTSISNAGDVNGDGFDDLIVGAEGADPNGNYSGSSYVVFGKTSGFDPAMNLSTLDGTNGFRLDGNEESDQAGRSVSTAGDVNGDGFDDLIIGANYADPGGVFFSGSCYVVFGKSSGFDATLSLSNLDGSNGFRMDGVTSYDTLGSSVSGAGDVNGDGFDDLIVGAYRADTNGSYSGSSYVIFGRSNFGGGNVIEGTPGDDNLKGTSAAERFEAGDGNDRMIGHGGADVFHGGAGNDRIRVSDLGFQLVDGGSGNNDVLSLGGGNLNLNLDLAHVRGKISGIEIIYLHGGSGDKTLILTAADVLNLSDTSNTLKVNGNEGDRVVLQGDWADGGIHGSFHTYTSDAATSNDAAVLLVGVSVTADFA